MALQNVFWEWVDVVQSFVFTSDGFFHGLVSGEVSAVGELVEGAVHDASSINVKLELTHDGPVHVGFPVGYSTWDDDVEDLSLVIYNSEG